MADVEVIPLFVVKKKEYKQREFIEKEIVENKKLPRIYISNIPYGTLEKDIKLLIEKVSPVREIYLPGLTPTGLYRDFAIVTLEYNDNEGKLPNYDNAVLAALKCVKALNNCIWKSVKIKVEMAKEYYVDTRKRELEEYEELNSIIEGYTDNEGIDDYLNDEKPLFNRNVLRFRKSRYTEPIIISCRPNLIKDMNEITKNITKNKKNKLDCGYKIKFHDDSDDERNYNEYIQEQKELFKSSEFIIDKFGIEKQKNDKSLGSKLNENEKSGDKGIQIVTKTGGGLRKGFGTLIGSGSSTVKVPANIIALRPGREDDECCVENHSFRKPIENMNSEFGDGEEEEDPHPYDSDEEGGQSNELCVQPEDLEAQALSNERKRALALITNMFGGDDTHNISNKEEDDNNLLAVPVIQSRKGWDSVLIKRFDPTKNDSIEKFEISTEDRIKNAMNNNTTIKKNDNNNISNNSSIIAANNSQVDSNGYANLSELKDIFYKEGGVWWGDDGTLNEAVSRGGAGQDKLFLEAEKLGFDIRTTTQKSEESNVMKFGFFDEEPNNFDSANDKITDEPKTIEQKWKQVIHNDKIEWLPDNGEVEVEKEKKQTFLSLFDIVRNAKKFSRGKPIAIIVSDWKESRIKLAVDYKRKRKESRKKSGIQAPIIISSGIKGYNNLSSDGIDSKIINNISSSNNKAYMKSGKSYRGGSKNKSKK